MNFNDTKLWVGPDKHLMAAVIKVLEQNGCRKSVPYNKDAPDEPLALYVTDDGTWYYSKATSRTSPNGGTCFDRVARKEIQLSDVLPVLDRAGLLSKKIRTGTKALNITVQEALHKLNIKWDTGPIVQYEDIANAICIGAGSMSYWGPGTSGRRWEDYYNKSSNKEIFLHQIPGIITTVAQAVPAMLRNVKIHVRGPNVSRLVQEELFRHGCVWAGSSSRQVDNLDSPFLYVDMHGRISHGHMSSDFQATAEREILAPNLIGKTYSSQTNTQQHDTTGKTESDPRSEGGRGVKVRIDECKIASEQRLRENGVRASPSRTKIGRSVLRGTLLPGQDYGG